MRYRLLSILMIYFTFISSSATILKQKLIPEQIIDISDYQYPQNLETEQLIRLVFIHQTDVHGKLEPQNIQTIDTKQQYQIGGYRTMSQLIHNIQQQYLGNTILLDSGDQFTGSLLSQYFNGTLVTESMNDNQLEYSVLGNHEFDFRQDILQSRINQSQFDYIGSNIKNRTDSGLFDNQIVKYGIIDKKGIKIGLIGLSTYQTYFTTKGDTSQLDIDKQYANVSNELAKMMKQQLGCQLVMISCHIGSRIVGYDYGLDYLQIYDKNSIKYKIEQNEFSEMIAKLDPNYIDGVFGGHTHNTLHQFDNGIPIMISNCYAKYLGLLYVDIDRQTGKILNKQIESPIPVCDKVFQNRKICDIGIKDNSETNNGRLIRYKFHGQVVETDHRLEQFYQPYLNQLDKVFGNGTIVVVDQPMLKPWKQEGAMQNMISDMMSEQCNSDIGIVNLGSIRIEWSSGPIDYSKLFDTIPFDNRLIKVQVQGYMLRRILIDIQQAEMKYYGVSNMLFIIENEKVQDILFYGKNGQPQPLDLSAIYSVVMPDILIDGGDDFKEVVKYFKVAKEKQIDCGKYRDQLRDYLMKQRLINTKQQPLVNGQKPRLIFK